MWIRRGHRRMECSEAAWDAVHRRAGWEIDETAPEPEPEPKKANRRAKKAG